MAIDVKNLVVGRFWDGNNDNIKTGYIDFGILGRIQLCMVRSERNNSRDGSDWSMQLRIDRTMFGILTFVQKQIENVLYEDGNDGTGKA